MNKFTKYMQDYLEYFKDATIKPKNDQQFIEEFTGWLSSLTPSCFEFEGDNGYCGFTIQVYKECPKYSWDINNHAFEISYSGEHQGLCKLVKVYTPNHNGFWVPEYIDLTGDECDKILDIIKTNLEQWGGF